MSNGDAIPPIGTLVMPVDGNDPFWVVGYENGEIIGKLPGGDEIRYPIAGSDHLVEVKG
jgi:uncharacterized membrane protein